MAGGRCGGGRSFVHGLEAVGVTLVAHGESPACGPLCDRGLPGPGGDHAGGREHPAVVGATGARAVLVDRAAVVAQHGAASVLVVAHHEIPGRRIPERGTAARGECAPARRSRRGPRGRTGDASQHAVHPSQGTSESSSPSSADAQLPEPVAGGRPRRAGWSRPSTDAEERPGLGDGRRVGARTWRARRRAARRAARWWGAELEVRVVAESDRRVTARLDRGADERQQVAAVGVDRPDARGGRAGSRRARGVRRR